MKLTIEANTIEELMDKVCSIANKFNVDLSENTKTIITPEIAKAVESVEAEPVKEEKPKKASKKTIASTADVSSEAQVVAQAVEEIKTITKDDVTAAVTKVSENKGLEKAREILGKFNSAKGEPVKRMSELLESDYAAIIAKCKQELN